MKNLKKIGSKLLIATLVVSAIGGGLFTSINKNPKAAINKIDPSDRIVAYTKTTQFTNHYSPDVIDPSD